MKHSILRTLALFALLPSTFAQIDLSGAWTFKTGDDPAYARAEFDDRAWGQILPTGNWEQQGFDNYNGFAWYRIRFALPATLRQRAFLRDSLRLLLGKIDDCDAVYLNGVKIGQTGRFPEEKDGYATAWDVQRRYMLATDNPALHWDAENVLAIRVYDGGGGGGFFDRSERNLDLMDLIDYVRLNAGRDPLRFIEKDKIETSVYLENRYAQAIDGEFKAQVFTSKNKNKPVWEMKRPLSLKSKETLPIPLTFPRAERARVVYTFTEKNTGKTRVATQETPYLLTPPESPQPHINNADAYGARPGVPFQYLIACSGKQPVQYRAKGLPAGLKLDSGTGIITGITKERGIFSVTLGAANSLGSDSKVVSFVIGNNICLTPPLGWNSWNCWGLSVSDPKVRASADGMVKSGLIRHGWTYMNIDDGWEAPERAPETGAIRTNEKFTDMKGLSNYVHSLGLKIGIYSSPGPFTCGGYLGSWQHETQDAQTWADWGIDYLKYDWCSYERIAPQNPDLAELKKPYEVMRAALNNTGRDIVYSLCQYGMGNVWQWGEAVGGNLWRTTGDIVDTWESLQGIGFSQGKSAPFARPGHWNDPDMLIVGWVGWGDNLHQTRLTPSEQYTHISLWALQSAPMLIGCDLSRIDDFTYNLLANNEVLAIDQDALGKAATPMLVKDDYQVWVKELADGSRAVGIFNLTNTDRKITVKWADLGLKDYKKVRDLWRQKDLGKFGKSFKTEVYGHGVSLIKVY